MSDCGPDRRLARRRTAVHQPRQDVEAVAIGGEIREGANKRIIEGLNDHQFTSGPDRLLPNRTGA